MTGVCGPWSSRRFPDRFGRERAISQQEAATLLGDAVIPLARSMRHVRSGSEQAMRKTFKDDANSGRADDRAIPERLQGAPFCDAAGVRLARHAPAPCFRPIAPATPGTSHFTTRSAQ